jgi:catechol 2,3-dioxygenase-like lactoylglutathione lyase family enzyme
MIDHFGFRVRDLARARFFYDAVLQLLGLQAVTTARNRS